MLFHCVFLDHDLTDHSIKRVISNDNIVKLQGIYENRLKLHEYRSKERERRLFIPTTWKVLQSKYIPNI